MNSIIFTKDLYSSTYSDAIQLSQRKAHSLCVVDDAAVLCAVQTQDNQSFQMFLQHMMTPKFSLVHYEFMLKVQQHRPNTRPTCSGGS